MKKQTGFFLLHDHYSLLWCPGITEVLVCLFIQRKTLWTLVTKFMEYAFIPLNAFQFIFKKLTVYFSLVLQDLHTDVLEIFRFKMCSVEAAKY